jgi:hypothetical protein
VAVIDQEDAPGTKQAVDARRPRIEVGEPGQDTYRSEHDVELTTESLRHVLVGALEERGIRSSCPLGQCGRGGDRLAGQVRAHDLCTTPGEADRVQPDVALQMHHLHAHERAVRHERTQQLRLSIRPHRGRVIGEGVGTIGNQVIGDPLVPVAHIRRDEVG